MEDCTSHAMERRDVLEYLRALDAQKVYYCPNPGNAGDSAIALGTYQLFDRAGISYELVRWDEDFDGAGKTLMYGGGGNLTASYPQASTFIKRHHRQARKMVVLPHTVQGNKDLLTQLGSNVDIFCRERRSFEWVSRHVPRANIYLEDDLAFRLDAEQVLADSGISPWVLARWIMARPIEGMLQRAKRTQRGKKIALRPTIKQGSKALLQLMRSGGEARLYAFRTDREKTGASSPPGNVDLSRVFSYGSIPKAAAQQATQAVLAYLNRYERITTNRLHICILATLLGKEVDFYANNYFKNAAVYEFSIKDRYSNVRWGGRWKGT